VQKCKKNLSQQIPPIDLIDALTIPVREHPEGPYRIVASRSHLNAATQAWIAEWSPSELIQAGSSLKFCRLAEDLADLYPRLAPTCEWDTAAAHIIVTESGASICQYPSSVVWLCARV
jgi:3'-phosphoadenosine 5'-phosphosulfate (PAPS) 3'-phosphatase